MSAHAPEHRSPVPRLGDHAELAWKIALQQPESAALPELLRDSCLLQFWSATREMSRNWLLKSARLLEGAQEQRAPESRFALEELASEVFVTDLLVRVYSTVILCAEMTRQRDTSPGQVTAPDATAVDQVRASDDHVSANELEPRGDSDVEPGARVRPLLDQAVNHVNHAATRLLELIVAAGEPSAPVDRLRRRCERWTDVLIGPWIVSFGAGDYAHDPRRAWDFGEENAIDLAHEYGRMLLRSSFEQAFRGRLLRTPIHEPAVLVVGELSRRLISSSAPRAAAECSVSGPPLTESGTETELRTGLQRLLANQQIDQRPARDHRTSAHLTNDATPLPDSLLERCLRQITRQPRQLPEQE